MAVFNKNDGKTTRERPVSAPRAASGEGAISIIGPGMRIEGDLATDGTVRIEGTIVGTIKAGKAVVLGQSGEVVGDIFTRDAVIGGRVRGTVVADSRLHVGVVRVEGGDDAIGHLDRDGALGSVHHGPPRSDDQVSCHGRSSSRRG